MPTLEAAHAATIQAEADLTTARENLANAETALMVAKATLAHALVMNASTLSFEEKPISIQWLAEHSRKILIPQLGAPLSEANHTYVSQLRAVFNSIGKSSNKKIFPLFAVLNKEPIFAGFSISDEALNAEILALRVKPQATMPDGQQRYGMAAIDMLVHKADGQRKMGGRG